MMNIIDLFGSFFFSFFQQTVLFSCISFSLFIFFSAFFGLLSARKHLILVIVCLELLLLAVNFNFLIFSVYLDDVFGEIFSLYILTVAAAESAIGLAILVIYYRLRGTISVSVINLLKG